MKELNASSSSSSRNAPVIRTYKDARDVVAIGPDENLFAHLEVELCGKREYHVSFKIKINT